MGEYNYTKDEKELLKVLENQRKKIISTSATVDKTMADTQKLINDAQKLADTLGVKLPLFVPNDIGNPIKIKRSNIPSWDILVEEAKEDIPYQPEIEDFLSASEIQYCKADIDRINNLFAQKTKLCKTDLAFLMIASALQTARWIIIQQLVGDLGQTIDESKRMDNKKGDEIKKKAQHEYNKNHSDRDNIKSEKYPTWKDIVFGQYPKADGTKTRGRCPYDAQKGGPEGFDEGGKGMHRQNTLGHDPILGWIFGTANIMTCTITLSKKFQFGTYRVTYPNAVMSERITAGRMFYEVYDSLLEDKYRLPAALFAQAAHLNSDVFTKWGLPVPLLETFSPDLTYKLYSEQYDSLCLLRDIAIVGSQGILAILINMIISLTHGLFYRPVIDGSREHYEVRTRKILLYSNAISSTINLGYVGANAYIGNEAAWKKLDLGGLLVTLYRLFADVRFITRVKEQFIQQELDKTLEEEIRKIDLYFE